MHEQFPVEEFYRRINTIAVLLKQNRDEEAREFFNTKVVGKFDDLLFNQHIEVPVDWLYFDMDDFFNNEGWRAIYPFATKVDLLGKISELQDTLDTHQ